DSALGAAAPGFGDLGRLGFTKMEIEESMRLYPPAWGITRTPIADDEIRGYRIPAGSIVLMSQWVVHRDPALWEDPERFDPQRFATERAEARPRYAYFPFGGGPRICIGNAFALIELTAVLAMVARRFRVRIVPGHAVEPEALVTLR